MTQYFPQPHDLSNYATRANLKCATRIDTSKVALKFNLVNLEAEVDKTDVGKLKTVSFDLSELSNVVNNDFVKNLCKIN